jgi:pimeloyl-ACP methyl ester carboxylesterase/ketosteroid isomerase-like protein
VLGDAVEEVRQAEIGFAKAFADRDKAKFFSYVAPDAVFMTALGTLRGKDAVVERWSRFFDGVPNAPFSWGPERVEVTAGGSVGFSMGPIYGEQGEHGGYYSSIWQKQADGSWKVIVDGPGNPPAPLPENTAPAEEGFVTAHDGAKLYYRKAGRGPITLIAPLGFVLHEPLKQFADVATVITYDPRNRGRSGRLDDVKMLTIENDVADLESVRAHFKAEKFVPVGFSYLGKMVVMYAAAHPERVARVIQLGPISNGPMQRPLQQQVSDDFGVPPAVANRWRELRAAGGIEKSPKEACEAQRDVLRFFLVGNPANASRIPSPCDMELEWPVNVNRHFEAHIPTVERNVLSAEQLRKVSMPVLTIHGTKDRNASYASGREWATILPNARMVTVEGAAHVLWADDPVTVFGAMRHFLRGEWPLGSVE